MGLYYEPEEQPEWSGLWTPAIPGSVEDPFPQRPVLDSYSHLFIAHEELLRLTGGPGAV